MAETPADVRRDIEETRERMSTTLTELEHRLNVVQIVRDHPWPALALAFGAGIALSASGTDSKAAAATMAATHASKSKVAAALDEIVANVMTGAHSALQHRIDGWVSELKSAVGGSPSRVQRPGMVASSGGYGTGPTDDFASARPGRAD
jgi:hypothetical protein